MSDKTKHPQHYKLPDMPYEAIDVIRAVLGEEGFRKFCRGNSLKYLIRADKKGGIYDLSKARDYIDYEMMGMQEPEEPPICGKRGDDTFMNYCPNCGAEMKGEGNADNSQI